MLLLFLFCLISLCSIAQTSWNFDTNLQGWHDLGDGRDVTASWENGNLKMAYSERSPGNGPQLWFPAVQVDNLNFSAASYPYLEIYYQANWPTVLNGKVLMTLTKTDNTVVHSFFDFDPTENFVSVDIAANVRTDWNGKAYDGQIKSIQLELPHNSSTIANPATNWFGLNTLIDKISLTATQTPKPDNRKIVKWSFETNFADDAAQFVCATSGTPAINTSNFKKGKAALYLDGDSYLTIPTNSLFTSKEQTISFWIKTIGSAQKYSSTPANLFSYNNGNYDLAINGGKLIFQKTSRLWDNLTTWNSGDWQHVAIVNERNVMTCYLNGKKSVELLNVSMTNRTGNIVIGNGGLIAYIDDFSVYNYALTSTEIAAQGSIPLNTISAWNFDNNLEGWHEIQDGVDRDVTLIWEAGDMKLTYSNKALTNGPQLWFPQVEIDTKFDAALYPYCDIYYQTAGWPLSTKVKAVLEMTKADGTVVYSNFDVNPTQNFVRVDFSNSIQSNGSAYSGEIIKVRLELPQNTSATPAESWFGASTKITKIEFKDIQPTVDVAWNAMLEKSAFIKSGLTKLNRDDFQYQPIGLGGTTMRVDPWGFGFTKAPMANPGTWHPHEPYLGYQYWWDNAGHRFNPFLLKAGYGATLNPGTITAFNQKLDIRTGELSIDLGLTVDGTTFTSKRTVFVTPEGILVIRVQDTGAPLPLQVNLAVEQDVRIYNNGGIYNVAHDPFTGSAAAREQNNTKGTVVTATRPNTSTASLAVAVESASNVTISTDNQIVSTVEPNGIVTYYIAPASSFNPLTPTVTWDHAWNAAYTAKQKGYETLRQETAAWWTNYFNRSKISVPDETVQKLYVQSLYYHGIYFGNTKIPPGCNSTDIESFGGAVCPEYDLVLSRLGHAVEHGAKGDQRDVAARLVNGRQRHRQQRGIFHVIEADHPDIAGDAQANGLERAHQGGGGVVIGADVGVGLAAGGEPAHELQVGRVPQPHPIGRDVQAAADQRLAHPRDARVHRRSGEGTGHEAQALAAQFQEVFGQEEPAGDVLDADQVEVAAVGEGLEVAVQQDHGDAGLAQRLGQAAVGWVLFRHQFKRGEEHPADLALDKLLAEFVGVLEAGVGVVAGMGRTAPEQAVIVHARQAGQFATDHAEDFGGVQAGNEQPQLARRHGRRRGGPEVSARAGAAFDQALGLQVQERSPDGGARDSELSDQLRLARQALVRAEAAGGDVGAQLAGDFVMFRLLGHA